MDPESTLAIVRRHTEQDDVDTSTSKGEQPNADLFGKNKPQVIFGFARDLPQGLAGNLNGWRNFSTYSAESEFFQWVNAQHGGIHDEGEDLQESTLCLLEHDGQRQIFRRLRGGFLVAQGQLEIDREPSTEMTIRKNDWAAAVARRDSSKAPGTNTLPQVSKPHACQFCQSNVDESVAPAWLYDRQQNRTIHLQSELPGGVPKYDVLSYTWGRAASDDWQDVDGIPWKIRSSTGLPVARLFEILDRFEARYLWIDVFCIPQDCPLAKGREVARQAKIFRGAEGGIAWLHQTSAVMKLLAGMICWAVLVHDNFNTGNLTSIPPPAGALGGLEELTSDPWFSSTWALQEAILCPNMRLMGMEEPSRIILCPYGNLQPAIQLTSHITVEDFRQYLVILRAAASSTIKVNMKRYFTTDGGDRSRLRIEDALRLEKLIQDFGLSAVLSPTPSSILASLQVRTPVKPHDKYYGIQSAFDLKMQGDYQRPLESVQAEFIGHIWTEFAPVLALALNRPVLIVESGELRVDAEDTLTWFTHSVMKDGRLKCLPYGYSKVRASATPGGKPILASSECADAAGDCWRYEACSEPPSHSRLLVVRYGLPPLPVAFSLAERMEHLYQGNPVDNAKSRFRRWFARKIDMWKDRRGTSSFMSRTTRLFYVGQFINETGHLGLRRSPHVYMEYYLTGAGTGHRVGAVLSDMQFSHRKVDGALILD